MTLHKLTAGDGYTYLTSQVASFDSSERGHSGLEDYYAARGESPGVWMGSGLDGLTDVPAGSPVTEAQMTALFGHGRHPNAERMEAAAVAAGADARDATRATTLGRPFAVYRTDPGGFRTRCAREFAELNASRGLPRGSPLPLSDRAAIRTRLACELFAETVGRAPIDRRELAGQLARASRPATTAVAGYDMTFSPVKSVSALWAIAPAGVSHRIEEAHRAAVTDVLSWLEQRACFTRLGAGGIRQIETRGLIAAAFTHRDSRAGDPDLHTHVAISNKVQAITGQWLAIDGRILYKANVAASERYNTMLEAQLRERLGLRFADRTSGDPDKRPVREIVGMDHRLLTSWSKRRRVIAARCDDLADTFQQDHGRPPLPIERIALAQQATLESRDAKHAARSLDEQRTRWRQEAEAVLGSPTAVTRMLNGALRPSHRPAPSITERWVLDTAVEVIETVSAERATWQRWHVEAEAQRLVRAAQLPPRAADEAVGLVVGEACSNRLSIPIGPAEDTVVPPALCRSDGTSVYAVAGAQQYTSSEIRLAEQALTRFAGQRGGRRVEEATLREVLAASRGAGTPLNPAQEHLVRELSTSGARLQLALAPAGSGKTTALRVLARAWTADGGTVIGLAPSAVATAALRDQLDQPCDTLAKLVWSSRPDRPHGEPQPDWLLQIGPDTLVLIDEAGMAGTLDLARAVAMVLQRGGAVRLIGDDQQLAAVAAGGILRDILAEHGAVSLSELVRFTDPAEAAATVAVRAGDPTALGFYLDRGRVHVGDLATACADAYAAWSTDRANGLDSLLLAPTRELVAALNARARADRLATTGGTRRPEVALADGNPASAGDLVISRRNDRSLHLSSTDWVKNGDRWLATAVHPDGALRVRHLPTGRAVTLPAAYVQAHVQLGYATTVHGAQGLTADTSHCVVTGTESRQLLYVALTRGRAGNHVHVAVTDALDEHSTLAPQVTHPPTATDVLTGVLARDGAAQSATTAARALTDPLTILRQAVARYVDALQVATETECSPAVATAIQAAADRVHPELRSCPGWPGLFSHLARLAFDGADPAAALLDAASPRGLNDAEHPAVVLQWRLARQLADQRRGPLPWLPPVPTALQTDPEWGRYFAGLILEITRRAAIVADDARTVLPTAAPVWGADLLTPQREQLRADLAVWRAAVGIGDDDAVPAGSPRTSVSERLYQRALEDALASAGVGTGSCWSRLADALDPRLREDPHWPAVAARLAAVDRSGLDAAGLLAAVAAQRPLPDDLPAAALWWRLSPHLTPPVVLLPGTRLPRPDWLATLTVQLGADRAEALTATPAWPALVAAVTAGTRAGWSATELLDAATSTPANRQEFSAGPLAEALVFRTAALTDPAPVGYEEPPPPDLAPPEDHAQISWPEAVTDVLGGPELPHPPIALEDTDPGLAGAPGPTAGPLDRWVQGEEADPADYLLDEHFWATAAAPRDRLIELNDLAAAFFTRHYPGSWAPDYLRQRLGSDLLDYPRFNPGWAPDSWRALTSHLRDAGATDEELLAAGLASRAANGQLIDRFRDRLVFPIHGTDGEIHGFVARRSPSATDADRGGPKYTNTPATDLFAKGAQLLGFAEGQDLLDAGAVPVLVEGPMDAVAVTLAGEGRFVGVAALGTALSGQQAAQLGRSLRSGGDVVVATDADEAGRAAATRAYWMLTARGGAPRQLSLPAGADPAELLGRAGAPALSRLLAEAPSLADALVADVIARAASSVDGAVAGTSDRVIPAIAEVIGALPPDRWIEHIDRASSVIDAPPGVLALAVVEAGERWTARPVPPSPASSFRSPAAATAPIRTASPTP